MLYYIDFLNEIQKIPIGKIKFADECHIVSKDLGVKKVLGLVNNRSFISENTINESNASLTILTTLTHEAPVIIDYRIESNNQWDFTDFVSSLLL